MLRVSSLQASLSESVQWGWKPVLRELDTVTEACAAMPGCTELCTSAGQRALLRGHVGRCAMALKRTRSRYTAQCAAAGGGALLEADNRLDAYLQIAEISCAALVERIDALGGEQSHAARTAVEELIALEVEHVRQMTARCPRAHVERTERWCDANAPPSLEVALNQAPSFGGDEDDGVGLDEFGDDDELSDIDGAEGPRVDEDGRRRGAGGAGDADDAGAATLRAELLPAELVYVEVGRPAYWLASEALCARLETLHHEGGEAHAIAAAAREVLARHARCWRQIDADLRALPASGALRPAPAAPQPCPTLHPSARLRLADASRPLVLLLGWWHSRPATVEKYAAVYAARGISTLALTATTLEIFLGYSSAALAARILDELDRITGSNVSSSSRRCLQCLVVLLLLGPGTSVRTKGRAAKVGRLSLTSALPAHISVPMPRSLSTLALHHSLPRSSAEVSSFTRSPTVARSSTPRFSNGRAVARRSFSAPYSTRAPARSARSPPERVRSSQRSRPRYRSPQWAAPCSARPSPSLRCCAQPSVASGRSVPRALRCSPH